MIRRDFLKTAGLGSLGAISGGSMFPNPANGTLNTVPDMKITKIDVVYDFKSKYKEPGDPWFMWVRLYTDNGIIGVGETYPVTEAQIGVLKQDKNSILGHDAIEMTTIMNSIKNSHYGNGAGTEMKIISAINMAQWDILGKAANMPIYKLMGGKYRPNLRIYHTCAGNTIEGMNMNDDAEKIVKFLMDKGIGGIKIMPYDQVAERNLGSFITPSEREGCLDWIKRIRNTAGKKFEIAIEFHSNWNLPSALKIAKDLEPYDVMWLEDMMGEDNMDSYSILCRDTSCTVAVSEHLATKYSFLNVLEKKAADLIILDIDWCGGISEAKKIVDLSDAYYIPFATHNFGGPLLWISSLHLGVSSRNSYNTESNWEMYNGQWPTFVKNVPVPVNGYVSPPEGPGLGVEFNDEAIKKYAKVEIIGELK